MVEVLVPLLFPENMSLVFALRPQSPASQWGEEGEEGTGRVAGGGEAEEDREEVHLCRRGLTVFWGLLEGKGQFKHR